MENKKGLELATSLLLSCITCSEKLIFWSDSLNLETVEKKGKKIQNIEYPKSEKSLLEESKTIFHNFLNAFFW